MMTFVALLELLGPLAGPVFDAIGKQLGRKDKPEVLEIAAAILKPVLESDKGLEYRMKAQQELMPAASKIFTIIHFGQES